MKVDLSDTLTARLQKIAVPLVDNWESVIAKCVDAYEKQHGTGNGAAPAAPQNGTSAAKLYRPQSPPDLTHTKVLSVEIDGEKLAKPNLYWNNILNEVIVKAKAKIATPDRLDALIIVNHEMGKKEDQGYHYIPAADISVQGQDANAAWKAIFHLVKYLDLAIDVTFMWYDNEKAVKPGEVGRLVYP